MRTWLVCAVLTLVLSGAAHCHYDGPWLVEWDFNDGVQGWSLNGTEAAWQAGGGVNGTGGLYLPNSAYAVIDTGMRLGGMWGQHRFVFEADVWVSDLGNFLQGSGISAMRAGDGKGPAVFGYNAANKGVGSIDRSWDGSTKTLSWVFEQPEGQSAIVPMWIKLQMDYGYSAPGYWSSFVYIPVDNARGPAGWYTIGLNRPVHPDLNNIVPTLRLGSLATNNPVAWSQARFDNARLVPEPSGLLALAGGIGFVLKTRKPRQR